MPQQTIAILASVVDPEFFPRSGFGIIVPDPYPAKNESENK